MNVLQRSTMMLVGIVALSVAGLFIWLILRKSRVSLKKKRYGDPVQGRAVSKSFQ